MATYTELRSLYGDEDLTRKVEVAVTIAAHTISTGADTAAPFDQTAGKHDLRVLWAQDAISNTSAVALDTLKLVLAANESQSLTTIQSATDTQIQDAVNAVVDALAAV